MALTATESRMARAALHLTIRQIATEVGLHPNTLSKFENSGGVHLDTARALEAFYKAAGIRFPSENVVDASAAQGETAPREPRKRRPSTAL